MTIIQPRCKSYFLTCVIVALVLVVGGASWYLVAMHASVVDTEHEIANIHLRIEKLESENATLHDKTFSILNREEFDALASERELIADRNPQYITINEEWYLASHY